MLHLWRPYILATLLTVFNCIPAQRFQEEADIREELNKDAERNDRIVLEPDETNHPEDGLPSVNFQCKGRPPGYYADPQHGCEVFHYCHKDGTRVTITCSEDSSNKHKICEFKTVAVKPCSESEIYFILPETSPQKKGKGTTAPGINDATDFKLPLVIPRPTVASYVVSHPTKPLKIEYRSDIEEESSKIFSSLAKRKASSPFRVGSSLQSSQKANVFEPYTPIRFDLKDGERIFEVFAGSDRSEKLHSEIKGPVTEQRYFSFGNNDNLEADESNSDNMRRRVPLKQKRMQILQTVFPSGVDKSKIHLRFSSKKPKTYFENPGYYDNKTDYKQYYIAKPGDTKSNESIYLIEVYHKDFDKDPVGDYSSYGRKAKNVSFLLSSVKSELEEALTKPKAKKHPRRRRKRTVASEIPARRPFAVIYAKIPGTSIQEGNNYPGIGRSLNQNQETIQASITPSVVPLDLSAIPVTIRSSTPQESSPLRRNTPRVNNFRNPKAAVIYDTSEEQSQGQQISEQRNVYYVSPEQVPQNSRSANPTNGNSVIRPIINPSYRITDDQQADPAQTPPRLQTENKAPSTVLRPQNNLPRPNTFSPGAQQVVPDIENGPKLLNQHPQGIPYFSDPAESHYFLDPRGIISSGQFRHFNPFGDQGFAPGRPLQDGRLILNHQQQHPERRPQRFPGTSSQNTDDASDIKDSSEEEKVSSINPQSSNTQDGNHGPQSQTALKNQPTFGLPPNAIRQAVFPGFSPFAPHDYSGPTLQQGIPLGIPPFGFIGPQDDRPSYPVPNIPQQFVNDRRPQQSFRGNSGSSQNLGRPTDTSSSEENGKEHDDRFSSERNQRGRYIPQQGLPQQISQPILRKKPDSSEERTLTHDNRNIQRPNFQQFTTQDVRPAHLNLGIPQNHLQRPIHPQNHPNIILPEGLLLQQQPRPFDVNNVNRGIPNERFQGLPPPNRLSEGQIPQRPSFTSEEEIIKPPRDYSRRPPPPSIRTHENTRSGGPSGQPAVRNVQTHGDGEYYSRRPTRPTVPAAQSPRPHRPSEAQSSRPHRPSDAQISRPHRPSDAQIFRPQRPPEAQISRPHRPSEVQSSKPHHPSEVQNSRPHHPSEAQSYRPDRPSKAQNPRPLRPAHEQNIRPLRPVQEQNTRPLRPIQEQSTRPLRPIQEQSTRPLRPIQEQNTRQLSPPEFQSSRPQRQPFISSSGNVRPQQAYEGIPHHLNKYAPEDERVLIHQNAFNNNKDSTSNREEQFQRVVSDSTRDYRPNRYTTNEERPHQKQMHNSNVDRSFINPNNSIAKTLVPSSENQIHYGHRNPSEVTDRNLRTRPSIRDSHPEYFAADQRKPAESPYSSYVNQEENTRNNPNRTPNDEHQRRSPTISSGDHTRQRQNENQGNSVNVISAVADYGSRPYHPYSNSETQDDKSSYAVNSRHRQITEGPEAMRSTETLTSGSAESEYGTRSPLRVQRQHESDHDGNNRGTRTSHRDESGDSLTHPPDPTTRPPPRRKPTPPRPTFPSFPTFPAPIRRPVSTIPPAPEDEASHPAEDTDEIDPHAHMRARQNSRPRIAPTVSTISYSTNIGPYISDERNEVRKTSKAPTTSPRQRPRKRAKGRIRRPKPTLQTTTDGTYEEPPNTVGYQDKKESLHDDKKYVGRTEHTTLKPEPLSTSYSSEVEVTTNTDGYGNRINLFSRQLSRRPSTFKQRFSTTTQSSVTESDGSVRKITAVPITRRRRPYKKRVRTKTTTTTTTESSVLTESESIARSDEEIESLLYVGRETTLTPTESTVQYEDTPVLPRSREPTALSVTTDEVTTVSENAAVPGFIDPSKVISDGGKRSVLSKFKSRPRLLRFGRPRPRTEIEEQPADNVVAESRTDLTTVSVENEEKR